MEAENGELLSVKLADILLPASNTVASCISSGRLDSLGDLLLSEGLEDDILLLALLHALDVESCILSVTADGDLHVYVPLGEGDNVFLPFY